MLSTPMRYKSTQNRRVGRNTLIPNANVSRHAAIAYIIIWRFVAAFDLQYDKLLALLGVNA